MKGFFRFLRNIIFLGIIAFGIWSYKTDSNFQTATNNAMATLGQRITQIVSTGKINVPNLKDNDPNQNSNEKDANANNTNTRTWSKPEATVYIDISNNPTLRSATVDAINVWNRTGAFTFKEIQNKDKANITVSVMDDSGTSAAGLTTESYNPVTGRLYHAKVQLNRYYLQNPWYGYDQNRIVNTAEHELGHAIGLNHTKSVSVMYPKGSMYTIQPQDIKDVKKLYHEK
ncbi:M57 family metalloprotease [Lactobacillus agrestimuris]|uniref:M57 family metalloprotease n=1 Tax=Lactobacillus agrestimuris TaxID=2941328 RepID=UPI00204342C2|nr:matrixin family metalloprotease [Lactobacillus agrestimuris]